MEQKTQKALIITLSIGIIALLAIVIFLITSQQKNSPQIDENTTDETEEIEETENDNPEAEEKSYRIERIEQAYSPGFDIRIPIPTDFKFEKLFETYEFHLTNDDLGIAAYYQSDYSPTIKSGTPSDETIINIYKVTNYHTDNSDVIHVESINNPGFYFSIVNENQDSELNKDIIEMIIENTEYFEGPPILEYDTIYDTQLQSGVLKSELNFVTNTQASDLYAYDIIKLPEIKSAYDDYFMSREERVTFASYFGVSTPAKKLTMLGKEYIIATGCIPHACGGNTGTILYATDMSEIYAITDDPGNEGFILTLKGGLTLEAKLLISFVHENDLDSL